MRKVGAPISLAGSQLGEARYVCAFFKNLEDEYRVTLPFSKDGFEGGDKAIHIIDPGRRADHLQRMASFGIETVAAQCMSRTSNGLWKREQSCHARSWVEPRIVIGGDLGLREWGGLPYLSAVNRVKRSYNHR